MSLNSTVSKTNDNLSVFVVSAFDPSGLLFASVVPWLDQFKVQVSTTRSSSATSSTALNTSLVLPKKTSVQAFSWAVLNTASSAASAKKKRKRSLDNTSEKITLESLVIVLGTNKGESLVYSPVENKILFKLSGFHESPITFVDTQASPLVYTCDSSGNIAQWDLNTKKLLTSFSSPVADVVAVKSVNYQEKSSFSVSSNPLLLASSSIFLTDLSDPSTVSKTIPAFASPISQIIASTLNTSLVFVSSKNERNVAIISLDKSKPVALLVAQANVKYFALSKDNSVAAIVTENGTVEIFPNPLEKVNNSDSKGTPSKSSKRKSLAVVSVAPTLIITVSRPEPALTKKQQQLTTKQKAELRVNVENVKFDDETSLLTLCWAEHGSVPVWESFEWKNSDGTFKSGDVSIVKPIMVPEGSVQANGSGDVASAKKYSEDSSAVKSGNDLSQLNNLNNLNTGDSDDEDDNEDSSDEEENQTLADRLKALDVDEEDEDADNKSSKSAASTKQSKESSSNATAILSREFDDMSLKTPESFTLVLSQALKTNDHSLLESLLTTNNKENIKISVSRLESSQAVLLLERLAEKVAQAPGRAPQLMIWIKWTLIAHGGYLIQLPNLSSSLSALHLTLSNKVGMLPRLLQLQGRVEMLKSQLEMRREIINQQQSQFQSQKDGDEAMAGDDDDDELDPEIDYIEDENVAIVNGEEDYDNAEEEDSEEDDDSEDDDSEEDEDSDEESFNPASEFIELEAEDDDEEESDEEDARHVFAGEEDYEMSDVEAEGVEAFPKPDLSDNDEDSKPVSATPKKSNRRKSVPSSNSKRRQSTGKSRR